MVLLLVLAVSFSAKAFDLRENVKQTYSAEIGVRELSGTNDGVEVEKYLASAGLDKGYAWCAAFVNWTLVQNSVETPKSPAWSPSWFPSARIIDKEKAQEGDVFGIYFTSKKRIAHVGFIDEWEADKNYCVTVEGNTNDAGSREGDGVYRKRRLQRQIYKVADWITQINADDKTLAHARYAISWHGNRSNRRCVVLC